MNLTHHRYCIVGQPRCGSHHFESYIYNTLIKNSNATKLGEYLHWWSGRFSRFKLENGNIIKTSVDKEVDLLAEFQQRIEMLKQNNVDQPLVARLFFVDNMLVNFKSLAELYANANFKFIYIKRDLEQQIISWYFSKDESKWSLSLFENQKIVDIELLKEYVLEYVKNQYYGEQWLTNIQHDCIDYKDLSDYPSEHFKMMPNDPYDLILNKNKVKDVFTNYLPLVQRQLSSLIC
jgi:hypothetical protein